MKSNCGCSRIGTQACCVFVLLTLATSQSLSAPADFELKQYKKAEVLFQRHDYRAAMAFLNPSIARRPKFSEAILLRGRCHLALDDADQAIADLTTALKLNPTLATAYYFRARALQEKGRTDASIEDSTKAIQIFPSSDHFALRGTLYFLKNDYKRALSDFDMALRNSPGDPGSIHYNRACVYEHAGDPKKAIEEYSATIKLGSRSGGEVERSYASRARLYEKTGRKDLAAKDWQWLKERTEGSFGL